MNNPTKNFEYAKEYQTRSICDHDCIFTITVVRRTAKTVWCIRMGYSDLVQCRVFVRDGEECIKPWGSYSMCPIFRAGKEVA